MRQIDETLKKAAEKKRQFEREQDRKMMLEGIAQSLPALLKPLLEKIAESARLTKKDFMEALPKLKLDQPIINVHPDVHVQAPDVIIPPITIPKIEIPTINVPAIKIPDVNVNMPSIMKVLIEGVSREDPLPVLMVGLDGKPMQFPIASGGTSGGRGDFFTIVDIRSSTGSIIDQTENALRVTGNFSTTNTPDATSSTAPDSSASSAYESGRGVVKASAGQLYTLTGYNSSSNALFIQIHNTATNPSDGAAPFVLFRVPPDSNFSYSPGEKFGKYFSTGITVISSTTGPTKTKNSSADCWFNVEYK